MRPHVTFCAQVLPAARVFYDMSRKYEIHSGRRTVSTQHSSSALQAAIDYVRSFGSSNDEITILGVDTVSWRGARFRAVPAPVAAPPRT
jgi:hypothetical protein